MNNQGVQPSPPDPEDALARTVRALRPMAPARDFATSRRFYQELGFRPHVLADGLVEMHLGAYSFILQDYYVEQWANNLVFHMRVSDVNLWWNRIVSLKLAKRYGIRAQEPRPESWGMVAGIVDPSGVLWRIAGPHPAYPPVG
jgi:catechol 2,3-dioxygenase-like lactoylglutathione lyase family enzyme